MANDVFKIWTESYDFIAVDTQVGISENNLLTILTTVLYLKKYTWFNRVNLYIKLIRYKYYTRLKNNSVGSGTFMCGG